MHTNNDNHGVFVTCNLPEGGDITFRVGQPVSLFTADDRYERLYQMRNHFRIHYMRRSYTPRFIEIRSTDKHGRGIGSERHGKAIAVPYAAVTAL